MTLHTAGIHHITAFARDPQANVDFYAGVLGLRLVKKTINFDATEVYHLYFGNEAGSPGTIITFFPWPESRRGRVGGGQVGVTSYVIPPGTMDFWEQRLHKFGISTMKGSRFSESYLQFTDNEGLKLELVEREAGVNSKWSFGGIPNDKAIKGFGGAVLYSVNPGQTITALEQVLGLEKVAEDVGYVRYRGTGDIGNIIDVPRASMDWGSGGAGTVHHIAWRATDYTQHEQWRDVVEQHGYQVTPVIDRQYFNAIYFREGGGILFEIATDPPGFAKDESADALGEQLMLPAWFEPHRAEIEANLLPITLRELEGEQS
ncbi:ring-cleaving dioxygenase [Paenibacillus sp. UMB4589-SE434]|uniref:ring-cleaving dioxygenase n=1 Tax=Paenibacillus sp. UMB4589-SE434 TaxID=3046314 RepID=UPI00254B2B78|nr:ring-cleaving dioxygenase [Paenibacillus sp. UMB4589-SE434]MDK8182902.1 ring-cleaving dioxygenase [Paenibacillus sp. UMB4589-SE434]